MIPPIATESGRLHAQHAVKMLDADFPFLLHPVIKIVIVHHFWIAHIKSHIVIFWSYPVRRIITPYNKMTVMLLKKSTRTHIAVVVGALACCIF